MGTNRFSRRQVLRGAALATGAGLAAGSPSFTAAAQGLSGAGQASAGAAATDYTTRAAFDSLDQGFNNGDGLKGATNESFGQLGWGESYVLQAYLLMFDAHGDTYYLDKAADHIDHVLANRDSVRRVADWRGLSLPGWRLGHPYACGELLLTDGSGTQILRLRSARAYSQLIEITVSEGTSPGTFRLYAKHPLASFNKPGDPCDETHDNLSMDPASPDYVVRRLWDAFSINDVQLTAKDLRPSPGPGPNPVAVSATMNAPFFHSSVHSGQIAYPIAKYARLVQQTPRLRASRELRARADEYYAAAAAALHIHDDEVRSGSDRATLYGYLKGSPVNLDGSDLPHNYSTSMARGWLELAMADGDREARNRATSLVRNFRDDIKSLADGTGSWTYYWTGGDCYRGWDRGSGISENMAAIGAGTRGEDISHGHIEMTMATTAYQAGVLVNATDLRMLANTLTRKVIKTQDDRPVTSTWVDGSGVTTGYRQIVAGWLGLAPFAENPAALVSTVHQMLRDTNPTPESVSIYASAWLNWAALKSR